MMKMMMLNRMSLSGALWNIYRAGDVSCDYEPLSFHLILSLIALPTVPVGVHDKSILFYWNAMHV